MPDPMTGGNDLQALLRQASSTGTPAPIDLQAVLEALGGPPASAPSSASVATPPFVRPSTPVPSMPSAPIGAPAKGGGIDWRALLQMVAPLIGGIATHGTAQTGFLNGMAQGQEMARQHQEEQRQRTDQKNTQGADFLMRIGTHAQSIDDPVALHDFLRLAEDAGTKAGYVKPGDVVNRFQVSPNRLAEKRLQELTDQLDGLEKSGYNLDELTQAGATLKLKDGSAIPIGAAVNLARKRPADASGAQIPRPDKTASSEEERWIAQRAKDYGYGSVKDVDNDTQLAWRSEFRAAGRADAAPQRIAPGGVDAQFNDLVDLWKQKNPGREVPADVRTKLRVQAKKEIGQADDRPPVTVNIPGLTDMGPGARVESAAQDIVNNRMAPSQLATFFTGMGKDSASQLRSLVMQRVKQLQPDFNFSQAEANYKFGSATGTQSTVRFLDNIEKTLPVLQQASDDFKRSGVRIINKALLAGKSQFGNTDVVKFEFARNILADEIAKILQGGGTGNGTSDAKLRQAQELLSGDMTTDQFSTALATARELLATRRESLTKGTFMAKPQTAATSDAPIQVGAFTVKVKK